jgi:hypothetical protein
MGKPSQFFLGALSLHYRISSSKLLIKVYQFFAHTIPLLSLILLHSLAVFVRLHLLDFYSSFSRSHYNSLLPLDISLTTTPNIACTIAL